MIWLHSQTLHSTIELGMAAKLVVEGEETATVSLHQLDQHNPTLVTKLAFAPDKTVTLEKNYHRLHLTRNSNSGGSCNHSASCCTQLFNFASSHITAWDQVWQDSDVIIEGDRLAQLSVRYNLFQLLAVAPRHDDRVSIPPKTLSGFAYSGHIFWDTEIFILPLLIHTQPDLAQNLLNYRYHTLRGARRKAQEMGYKGAFMLGKVLVQAMKSPRVGFQLLMANKSASGAVILKCISIPMSLTVLGNTGKLQVMIDGCVTMAQK